METWSSSTNIKANYKNNSKQFELKDYLKKGSKYHFK